VFLFNQQGGRIVETRPARAADPARIGRLDDEAFSPYGTAEALETFALRPEAFPAGFGALVLDNALN
jgi:hypothetical protein